jgi:phage terminase large subunit
MAQITIPNDWLPMQHQQPVWGAMQAGVRRAALHWHRRAGKDSFAINFLATRAMQRPGVYWHMLPSAVQGRKVIWNGIDRAGRKVLDQAIPHAIRKSERTDEMYVELINGSIIQIVGSDNYDSLVGANPIGVVFSEYAISSPSAWNYIRPMLRENGGFAIFISTARGHNHFYDLYHRNEDNPNWFCETLTVNDTFREDGSPIITPEDIEEERLEGMDESMIQQEYFCSWEGGLEGAFYTEEVADIRKNRTQHFPNDQLGNVLTAWDIGFKDKTAIGVFARHPTGAPILMDAYEDRNKGLPHYVRHVKQMPYNFHWHFGPHDMNKTEFGTANRVVDTASQLGMEFEVLPKMDIASGIDLTRSFLRKLYVNENDNTNHVLNMLASYRRQYDEKRQRYLDQPYHNFASDTSDMMRYAATAWDPSLLTESTARRSFVAKSALA